MSLFPNIDTAYAHTTSRELSFSPCKQMIHPLFTIDGHGYILVMCWNVKNHLAFFSLKWHLTCFSSVFVLASTICKIVSMPYIIEKNI